MQEYDPNNIWQQFLFVGGKLKSFRDNGGYKFFVPHPDDARDTSKCESGTRLVVRHSGVNWLPRVDGAIAMDIDCTVYQRPELVITSIEDGNIDHYESVKFAFVNPQSGMAFTMPHNCPQGATVAIAKYDPTSTWFKFKLEKHGDDRYRIETAW